MAVHLNDGSLSNEAQDSDAGNGLLVAGGFLAALLASSCCIVPLVLVMLGIGGSWMSQLTALEPYQTYFAVGAFVLIGVAFWSVYFKRQTGCEEGGLCHIPTTKRVTKSLLWMSTVLVILSLTVEFWAPLFY